MFLQHLAKCQKAEITIQKPIITDGISIRADATDGMQANKANDHPKIWPKNMMVIIKSIVNLYSPCPEAPLFAFEMAAKATEKKFLVLKRFDFDIKQALEVQAKSLMGYGSEFRKGDILHPLL